jgi:hypothetical protein
MLTLDKAERLHKFKNNAHKSKCRIISLELGRKLFMMGITCYLDHRSPARQSDLLCPWFAYNFFNINEYNIYALKSDLKKLNKIVRIFYGLPIKNK